MSLFVLGDLHLSLGEDKPMDIFKGWDGYLDKLTENWNNAVGDNDTVVVNGDISWAMSLESTETDFRYINDKLHGKKIFIKGNHDYWWSTKSKMDAFLLNKGLDKISILNNNAFLVEGATVCGTRGWINDDTGEFDLKLLNREAGRLEMSLKEGVKLGGELTVFIHYPPVFGGEKNYYILDVLKKYGVKRCYYGHVHGMAVKKAFTGMYEGTEFCIASCDCVGFSPVLVKA